MSSRNIKIDLQVEMPLELGSCLFLLCIRKVKSQYPQKRAGAAWSKSSASGEHLSSSHLAAMSQEGQSLCLSPQCAHKSSPPKRGAAYVVGKRTECCKPWLPLCKQQEKEQTLSSLTNLAVTPPPNKPFGKFFDMDYLKANVSLLQSLLEVKA